MNRPNIILWAFLASVPPLVFPASPVDITDNLGTKVFTMHELWLTISGCILESPNGHTSVPLSLVSNPVVVDIMTLDTTSVLFALGSFPAGMYEEVEFFVSSAEMIGYDVTGQPSIVELEHSEEFTVEFTPHSVLLDPQQPQPIAVDWQPSVKAVTSPFQQTTYYLDNEVSAFVFRGQNGAKFTAP